jgi:hypothetical protein
MSVRVIALGAAFAVAYGCTSKSPVSQNDGGVFRLLGTAREQLSGGTGPVALRPNWGMLEATVGARGGEAAYCSTIRPLAVEDADSRVRTNALEALGPCTDEDTQRAVVDRISMIADRAEAEGAINLISVWVRKGKTTRYAVQKLREALEQGPNVLADSLSVATASYTTYVIQACPGRRLDSCSEDAKRTIAAFCRRMASQERGFLPCREVGVSGNEDGGR